MNALKNSPILVIGTLFPEAVPHGREEGESGNLTLMGEDVDSTSNFNQSRSKSKPKLSSGFLIPGIPILRIPTSNGLLRLSPLRLTRHEAKIKRTKVLKKRDELAERLGMVAKISNGFKGNGEFGNEGKEKRNLDLHVEGKGEGEISIDQELQERNLKVELKILKSDLDSKLKIIEKVLGGNGIQEKEINSKNLDSISTISLTSRLSSLLQTSLPTQISSLDSVLSPSPKGLSPPTYLTRIWPNLILIPLTSLITIRLVLKNWSSVVESLVEGKETLIGFFRNWCYEPLLKLAETVRVGDKGEGMIVSKESLRSDLESLQRMVVDFAVERNGSKLGEDGLKELKRRVGEGDLSEVMKVYEGELKVSVPLIF